MVYNMGGVDALRRPGRSAARRVPAEQEPVPLGQPHARPPEPGLHDAGVHRRARSRRTRPRFNQLIGNGLGGRPQRSRPSSSRASTPAWRTRGRATRARSTRRRSTTPRWAARRHAPGGDVRVRRSRRTAARRDDGLGHAGDRGAGADASRSRGRRSATRSPTTVYRRPVGAAGAWARLGTTTVTGTAAPASRSAAGVHRRGRRRRDVRRHRRGRGRPPRARRRRTARRSTPYPQNPALHPGAAGRGHPDDRLRLLQGLPEPGDGPLGGADFPKGASFVDGPARAVPRYPSNVYYNVANRVDQLDEYNWIYTSPAGGGNCVPIPASPPATRAGGLGEYLDSETRIMFGHLTGNDPRPHYFHQTNIAQSNADAPDHRHDGRRHALRGHRQAARALRRGLRPRQGPALQLTHRQVADDLAQQEALAGRARRRHGLAAGRLDPHPQQRHGRRRRPGHRHEGGRALRRPELRLDHDRGADRAEARARRPAAGRAGRAVRDREGRPDADGDRRHVDGHGPDRAPLPLAALRRHALHDGRRGDRDTYAVTAADVDRSLRVVVLGRQLDLLRRPGRVGEERQGARAPGRPQGRAARRRRQAGRQRRQRRQRRRRRPGHQAGKRKKLALTRVRMSPRRFPVAHRRLRARHAAGRRDHHLAAEPQRRRCASRSSAHAGRAPSGAG